MFGNEAQDSNWLQALTAVSTAVAVLFAAIGAWISWVSAKAARDAVREARLARRSELAPKLILEKEFLDFQFFWPHESSLSGEPVFLARKHWSDSELVLPTFSLQNFGQSPALEVTVVWDLSDTNGEFRLPEQFEQIGLSITEIGITDQQGSAIKTLTCIRPSGGQVDLPLYRRWTTDIPSCSPSQKRTVEFPVHLLNTFFVRGLQAGLMPKVDMVLTATVSCYAVDEVLYKTQFRWKVRPFYHGHTNPIVVYGHFFELPIYPKPDGPRVA